MTDLIEPGPASMTDRRSSRVWRRIRRSFWFNLLAACVVIFVIQACVVKVYYVPSGSMERTLLVGDRVLVDRNAYRFAPPSDGDIVAFTGNEQWGSAPTADMDPVHYALRWIGGVTGVGPSLDHLLVKRVIGSPGETISCCDAKGQVLRDGTPLAEPYVYEDYPFASGVLDCQTEPASMRCFAPITVKEGEFLVLGDHRSRSDDSVFACRVADSAGCAKFADRSGLIGRVFLLVLPLNRWTTF
ncbi:signal peptidase I [Agreia sp. PsM10]|uniref:signal peptidase I n=1 Tax=Agreia sp. PsM10 TaxID=3030533 RepID=UPI00263B2B63|nr:signal peptidase I [Agreia sp. PsM10]MDN4641993.1 signal peptidase I [Agreia sp. PsM10]